MVGHRDGGRLVLELYAHPDEQRIRQEISAAFENSDSYSHPLEINR